MPDGRVGHAELELADGVIYLADEHPEIGVRAPDPAGVPVSLVLEVADVDDVAGAAVEAGARLDRGPYEAHGHRNITLTDPYGHRWMLQARLPAAAAGGAGAAAGGAGAAAGGAGVAAGGAGTPLRQGDIGYASLWVPDVVRATAFYGSVLGLAYVPAQDARGRQATGVTPPQGLWEGHAHSTLFCSFVVDDAAAAVARVRAAGGEADEPVQQPYGLSADCVDVDGVRFAVHQPPAVTPGAARPTVAGHDGDLIYVTLEVPDSARTLAFYSAVLGWRYQRGRVPDGWQIEDTTPMIGVSGGHAAAAEVPVWRVADVAAAVGRVRAAGGTSTEPHQEPYGADRRVHRRPGHPLLPHPVPRLALRSLPGAAGPGGQQQWRREGCRPGRHARPAPLEVMPAPGGGPSARGGSDLACGRCVHRGRAGRTGRLRAGTRRPRQQRRTGRRRLGRSRTRWISTSAASRWP